MARLEQLGYDIYIGVGINLLNLKAVELDTRIKAKEVIDVREGDGEYIEYLRSQGVDVYGARVGLFEGDRGAITENITLLNKLNLMLPENAQLALNEETLTLTKADLIAMAQDRADPDIKSRSALWSWLGANNVDRIADKFDFLEGLGVNFGDATNYSLIYNRSSKETLEKRKALIDKTNQLMPAGKQIPVNATYLLIRYSNILGDLAKELGKDEIAEKALDGMLTKRQILADNGINPDTKSASKRIILRDAMSVQDLQNRIRELKEILGDVGLKLSGATSLVTSGVTTQRYRDKVTLIRDLNEQMRAAGAKDSDLIGMNVKNLWHTFSDAELIAQTEEVLDRLQGEKRVLQKAQQDYGLAVSNARKLDAKPQKSFKDLQEIVNNWENAVAAAARIYGATAVDTQLNEANRRLQEANQILVERETQDAKQTFVDGLNKAISDVHKALGIEGDPYSMPYNITGDDSDLNELAKARMLDLVKMPVRDEGPIMDNPEITPGILADRILAINSVNGGARAQVRDIYGIDAYDLIAEAEKVVNNTDMSKEKIDNEYFLGYGIENFTLRSGKFVDLDEQGNPMELEDKLIPYADKIINIARALAAEEERRAALEEGEEAGAIVEEEAPAGRAEALASGLERERQAAIERTTKAADAAQVKSILEGELKGEDFAKDILRDHYGIIERDRQDRHYFLAKFIQQRDTLDSLEEMDPEDALGVLGNLENSIKERAYFYAFAEGAEEDYTDNYNEDIAERVVNPWETKIGMANRDLIRADSDLWREFKFSADNPALIDMDNETFTNEIDARIKEMAKIRTQINSRLRAIDGANSEIHQTLDEIQADSGAVLTPEEVNSFMAGQDLAEDRDMTDDALTKALAYAKRIARSINGTKQQVKRRAAFRAAEAEAQRLDRLDENSIVVWQMAAIAAEEVFKSDPDSRDISNLNRAEKMLDAAMQRELIRTGNKEAIRVQNLYDRSKDIGVLRDHLKKPDRALDEGQEEAVVRAREFLTERGVQDINDLDSVSIELLEITAEVSLQQAIGKVLVTEGQANAAQLAKILHPTIAKYKGDSEFGIEPDTEDAMEDAKFILERFRQYGDNLHMFDIVLTLIEQGFDGRQLADKLNEILGEDDVSIETQEKLKQILVAAERQFQERAQTESEGARSELDQMLEGLEDEAVSTADAADEAVVEARAPIVEVVTEVQRARVENMTQDVRTYAEAVEYADTGNEADKAGRAEYFRDELDLEKARLEKMQQAAISKYAKDRIANQLIPQIDRLIEELKTPSIEAMKNAANLLIKSKYGIGVNNFIQVRNVDGLARNVAIYRGINFDILKEARTEEQTKFAAGLAMVDTLDNNAGSLNFANLGDVGRIIDVRDIASQTREGDIISFTLLDGNIVIGRYQGMNVDLADYPRSTINVGGEVYNITSIAEINDIDWQGQTLESRSQEKIEVGQEGITERIEALEGLGIKFSYSGKPVSVERGLDEAVQSRLDRIMAINFINSQRIDRTGEVEKTFERFDRDTQNRYRVIDQGVEELSEADRAAVLGSGIVMPEEVDVRSGLESFVIGVANLYNNPEPFTPSVITLPEGAYDSGAIFRMSLPPVVYENVAASKIPGTAPSLFRMSPENRQRFLDKSRENTDTSGVVELGRNSVNRVRSLANDLLAEFSAIPKSPVKKGLEIKDFEIREVNFSEVEGVNDYDRYSIGVMDRGNLVVILNSNPERNMTDEFEQDEVALASLLVHEFLEVEENLDHPAIKQVERQAYKEQPDKKRTTGFDIPLLESKELLYMTQEELEAIEPVHSNDPEFAFYNAAQEVLMERRIVDLMNNFRPNSAPYRIIMSVTQEQWDEIGRKRAVGLDESERKMARRAGLEALEELAKKANVKIEYYVRGDEDSFKAALTKAADDEFTQSIDSRVIAFVDTSLDAARLKDEFGATLEAMNQSSNKISGFPREQFDNGEDYTQTILHNLLGIGLIDYKAYMEAEQYEIAQGLLTSVQKIMRYITDDSEFIKDLSSFDNMKNFLNGISILRIRKIDLNELTEQENALRQVLRAL